jgi:hypothetical protein
MSVWTCALSIQIPYGLTFRILNATDRSQSGVNEFECEETLRVLILLSRVDVPLESDMLLVSDNLVVTCC